MRLTRCKSYGKIHRENHLILIILACILFAGCSTQTKHKVLTFFFTGVPEPGQEYVTSAGDTVTLPPRKKNRRAVTKSKYFVHGPYAARQCQQCHSAEDTSSFINWGGNQTSNANVGKRKVRQRVSGKLALPIEELCINCHESQTETRIGSVSVEVHEPVAKGLCYQCHHPHKSTRQYMLRTTSNIELCGGCHKKEEIILTASHQENPQTDCLQCHNPHQGKTALLLKTDFDEWDRY